MLIKFLNPFRSLKSLWERLKYHPLLENINKDIIVEEGEGKDLIHRIDIFNDSGKWFYCWNNSYFFELNYLIEDYFFDLFLLNSSKYFESVEDIFDLENQSLKEENQIIEYINQLIYFSELSNSCLNKNNIYRYESIENRVERVEDSEECLKDFDEDLYFERVLAECIPFQNKDVLNIENFTIKIRYANKKTSEINMLTKQRLDINFADSKEISRVYSYFIPELDEYKNLDFYNIKYSFSRIKVCFIWQNLENFYSFRNAKIVKESNLYSQNDKYFSTEDYISYLNCNLSCDFNNRLAITDLYTLKENELFLEEFTIFQSIDKEYESEVIENRVEEVGVLTQFEERLNNSFSLPIKTQNTQKLSDLWKSFEEDFFNWDKIKESVEDGSIDF